MGPPKLLICDMQTKFKPVIDNFEEIESSVACLAQIFKILSWPIIVTTQNTARLGETVPSVAASLPQEQPQHDKTKFSMLIPSVVETIEKAKPSEVVIVGIETQICVAQTALELMSKGFPVTILADAASSSSSWERETALERLRRRHADVTSLVSWVYAALKDATHPKFKEISALLRKTKSQRGGVPKASL